MTHRPTVIDRRRADLLGLLAIAATVLTLRVLRALVAEVMPALRVRPFGPAEFGVMLVVVAVSVAIGTRIRQAALDRAAQQHHGDHERHDARPPAR